MLRVNVVLIVLVLASALGVVASQHQARKLFVELEREQTRMHALEVEWGQFQLEQGTWSGHVRIEKLAREQLKMQPPAGEQVIALDAPEAAR
ncbi:cell division protein FtsL [Niveibacterium terrae]|uniref:cell division protein FtsL n=1 Tax=Niveibacterium terrae TaxID=3373598 RepID=UPI003A93F7BF